MANIKNITKKLVNLGFSEDKLIMMTEKEIREAYKTLKESTMKNNTNTTETNNSTTTVVKEEITVRELMNNTINRIMTATKVQDDEYVTRDELVSIMEQLTGVRPGKKVTRKQMVQDLYVLKDDLMNNTETNRFPVGDFCYDTVDIDDISNADTVGNIIEYTDDMSMKILKSVILQANSNKYHNFISDWMLTSIISEMIVGKPLKGKDENGKWIEFYKSFSDIDKNNINTIKDEFLKRSKFIPNNNGSVVTGYTIPAASLVYGRHKWLGYACVYHFFNKNNGKTVVYHVSLSGIKRIDNGVITPFDNNKNEMYKKLDTLCTFIC